MYYGNIKMYDIADGEGCRVTLFVSGCTNACKGCFQKETWDFHYGQPYTMETEEKIMEYLKDENIQGLTLLGGEPMEPENQRVLVRLLERVKRELPTKDVWCFTGFVLDRDLLEGQRKHTEVTDEMLGYVDILVDGPFVEEKKNLSLFFRGSENQRVIDMNATRKEKRIVLYHD